MNFLFFFTPLSLSLSVLLCFVREQRREKNRDQKREKTEKKRGSKKDQKISSLEESQQNESNFSLYLYAHIIKNRECT